MTFSNKREATVEVNCLYYAYVTPLHQVLFFLVEYSEEDILKLLNDGDFPEHWDGIQRCPALDKYTRNGWR